MTAVLVKCRVSGASRVAELVDLTYSRRLGRNAGRRPLFRQDRLRNRNGVNTPKLSKRDRRRDLRQE